MGADVIKIEAPGGTIFERNWAGCDLFLNGVSVFFLCAHRNQRSLALDLKHPRVRPWQSGSWPGRTSWSRTSGRE